MTVLAAAGTSAVTHRAVAKAAGVPLAATTYYFRTKDELLVETFRWLAAREVSELERAVALLPERMSPSHAARLAARFVFDDLRAKRAQIVAELELHLEAGRRPELRTTHRRLTTAALSFCEQFVARAGSRAPELDGALFLSVTTGLQLGELSEPTRGFEDSVALPLYRRLFAALCDRTRAMR